MEEKEFLSLEELVNLLITQPTVETDLTRRHGKLVAIDVEQQSVKIKEKVETGLYTYYYAQISDGISLYKEDGD